jgi:hypothetical protein
MNDVVSKCLGGRNKSCISFAARKLNIASSRAYDIEFDCRHSKWCVRIQPNLDAMYPNSE